HSPVLRSLALVLGLKNTSHRQLTDARLLIEPPIARMAAERARKEDIALLERVLAGEEEDAARSTFHPTDSQFHRSVADCTHNLPLTVLMNALADLTADAASTLDLSTRARHRARNCRYHRQLLEAIRSGDGAAAYATMPEHVSDIQRRVHRSLTKRQKANGGKKSSGFCRGLELRGVVIPRLAEQGGSRRPLAAEPPLVA